MTPPTTNSGFCGKCGRKYLEYSKKYVCPCEAKPTTTASALTDSQIVERLAKFMDGKWKNHGLPFGSASRILAKKCVEGDWNLWREVEEKVMENEELGKNYMRQLCFGQLEIYEDEFHLLTLSMKFNLRTRALALVSYLDYVS